MARINEKAGQVGFVTAIKDFFRGYFDFKGRSTRAGFWWVVLGFFMLSLLLIPIVSYQFFQLVNMIAQGVGEEEVINHVTNNILMTMIIVLVGYLLLFFIPNLALAVRRSRDAGMNGRGFLILWIASFVLNFIVLIQTINTMEGMEEYYSNGPNALFLVLSYLISLLFFILTVLPSDALTTRSENKFVRFFLRKNDAIVPPKLQETERLVTSEISTEKTEKPSFRRIFSNFLKTTGFIIWAICPITFIMISISKQSLLSNEGNIGISLAYVVFVIFSIRWIWNYYKKHTDQVIQKIRMKDFGIAFGLFILLRIIAVVGTLLNAYVTGNIMTSNDAALQSSDPLAIFPLYFILFNLTLGIFAPILEELAFRGIFIDIWFKSDRKWLPAMITSTIFALAHGFDNLITFSMYFSMGLTFYFAYYRRGNIKDSMLVHILNNGFIMLVSFISYLVLYFG